MLQNITFLQSLFLFSTFVVLVPILIALWSKRRHHPEFFGGFYLLLKYLETTRRKLRLLEWLKLLNRILLFLLLVMIFAEPVGQRFHLQEAEAGFTLLLDGGRVMQARAQDGIPLVEHQEKKVFELLKKMPLTSQGSIFFVSDRCDFLNLKGRLTATAQQWLNHWSRDFLPYSNAPTTSQGLQQCLQRIKNIFSEKNIYTVFISPLPNTLDTNDLTMNIEKLPSPPVISFNPISFNQEATLEKIRFKFDSSEEKEATLIWDNKVEHLGKIKDSLDLLPLKRSWLWFKKPHRDDPWVQQWVVPLEIKTKQRVTLWGMTETPGFLSLFFALRNHPWLKVTKQVGGAPKGDVLILYGHFPWRVESLESPSWFFLNPEAQIPYAVRDKKNWIAGMESVDIRKSFTFKTQEGNIFVKHYLLLEMDQLKTLETFEDGAPVLMQDQQALQKRWISPFDLEDLTTDLTLEPTFIPWFYRHLQKWLSLEASSSNESSDLKPLWLLPGQTRPQPGVLERRGWPGIYVNEKSSKIVLPQPLPQSYGSPPSHAIQATFARESVSWNSILFKVLCVSFLLELSFCLMAARFILFLLIGILGSVFVDGAETKIPLGIFSKMDPDRKVALQQLVSRVGKLSNLEFDSPKEIQFDELWKYAVVIGASTSWEELTAPQREMLRDYCERGGLLLFDDPLAVSESSFYRQIKKELEIIFPGRMLQPLSREDVLFRTFYLLTEVSGRKLTSPHLEGIQLDKRWVVLFSLNDLLGANLRSSQGEFAFSVTPYGVSQRILAERLLLNMLMYGVALDYKDDAIHLPFILKRRVK